MTDPAGRGSGVDGPSFEYPPVVNQVSGAAPNLTHLMSRTTFAGAMFDLRYPPTSASARRDVGRRPTRA